MFHYHLHKRLPPQAILFYMTCINKICNKNNLLHLVGFLFPHIKDDTRSKPHQIFPEYFEIVFLNIHTSPNLVGPFSVYLIFLYLITLKYIRHYPPEIVRICTHKIDLLSLM